MKLVYIPPTKDKHTDIKTYSLAWIIPLILSNPISLGACVLIVVALHGTIKSGMAADAERRRRTIEDQMLKDHERRKKLEKLNPKPTRNVDRSKLL